MTVHERILLLRLLEKQSVNPNYMDKIGVKVNLKEKTEIPYKRRKL